MANFGQNRPLVATRSEWTVHRDHKKGRWLVYWQRSQKPELIIKHKSGQGYSYRFTHYSCRADGKVHGGFASIKALLATVTR